MKTRTEIILAMSKILSALTAVGYSIVWGGHLLTFVSSFINIEWSKRTYLADPNLFSIRDQSTWLYIWAMCLIIAAAAIKALVWYLIFALLLKLKLQHPFSIEVERRLETIAYLLLGVWLVSSFFWKTYSHYLTQDTGLKLPIDGVGDEYLFIAGIVYIVSQIFKRGIEIQEENQLTV